MKTFKKIIGGATLESTREAVKHFENIGIKTLTYTDSNNSEAAKIFSTTRYGWDIFFMRFVYKYCRENNLNFNDVYKTTTEIYRTPVQRHR